MSASKIGPKRYLRELSAAVGRLWKEGARWIGYAATFVIPVLLAIIIYVLARFGLAIEWAANFSIPQLVAGFGVLWFIFCILVFAPYEVWREKIKEIADLQAKLDGRQRQERRAAVLAAAMKELSRFLRVEVNGVEATEALRKDISQTLGAISTSFEGVLSVEEITIFEGPVRPRVTFSGNNPELAHLRNVVQDRLQTIRELLAR